ncbi:MAG: NAD(P)/FAD-dependent oxidoreductase [Acidimicrobiales bacterium]
MGATITADYLVMGAGATGMAFVDTILTETDGTVVIVDRRDRPGGHWNDAYPFVRLHQPANFYGVNSLALGSGLIDEVGLNAGFYELAAGPEVVSHYDLTMRHRFLPSGRVTYLPMSEVGEDRVITSLLSGERTVVDARRFVDATYSRMRIPSTSPPLYSVAEGLRCAPPNELAHVAPTFDDFVVIGAGKTGMDTCLWLLENGVEPDRIRWIVPRDSWVLNRRNFQPGEEFFAGLCKSLADQTEATALADSVDDLFARLEAVDEVRRLDPNVTPEAYHCAILSDPEMVALRRIGNVIRLGHVAAIEVATIVLEHGSVPTGPTTLHIDCSASGFPSVPSVPVFDGDRITLQCVRLCQLAFSSAFIGFVESHFTDDATKNRICTPVVPPTVPLDWLRMFRVELANRACWTEFPELGDWMATSRLDLFTPIARTRVGVDVEATEHLGRYLTYIVQAQENVERLLA